MARRSSRLAAKAGYRYHPKEIGSPSAQITSRAYRMVDAAKTQIAQIQDTSPVSSADQEKGDFGVSHEIQSLVPTMSEDQDSVAEKRVRQESVEEVTSEHEPECAEPAAKRSSPAPSGSETEQVSDDDSEFSFGEGTVVITWNKKNSDSKKQHMDKFLNSHQVRLEEGMAALDTPLHVCPVCYECHYFIWKKRHGEISREEFTDKLDSLQEKERNGMFCLSPKKEEFTEHLIHVHGLNPETSDFDKMYLYFRGADLRSKTGPFSEWIKANQCTTRETTNLRLWRTKKGVQYESWVASLKKNPLAFLQFPSGMYTVKYWKDISTYVMQSRLKCEKKQPSVILLE